MNRIALVVAAMATTLSCVDLLPAAEPTSQQQLSAGVIALYQGRYDLAIQQFDLAQGALARDPRLYFYRGVAKLRQGRRAEAESDFRAGAHIEMALGRLDVGRALQRIQGSERLLLERFRAEARKLPRELVMQSVPQSADQLASQSHPPRRASSAQSARRSRSVPSVASLPDDPNDPFREGATGFLGRGEVRRVAAEDQLTGQDPYGLRAPRSSSAELAVDEDVDASFDSADSNVDSDLDQPVGTGVADGSAADDTIVSESATDDRVPIDPFSVDDDDDMSDAASSAAASDNGSPSIFGAALRALTRGLVTALPSAEPGQQLLPRATGGAGASA